MYPFPTYDPVKRRELISEIQNYFDIRELVSQTVYKLYGQRAWKFFDTEFLETLLWIRININRPITANAWHRGGRFSQRGLRTNLGYIFKKFFKRKKIYLSGHIFGKALDFDVQGMKAEEVRNWLLKNQDQLPHKIRLEWKKNGVPISWVHLDTLSEVDLPKVYRFNI